MFKSKIGERFFNKKGEEIVILEKIKKGKNARYLCEFTETGYVSDFDYANLQRGSFKDYNKPSVFGVGYSYKGATKSPIYKKWNQMLERCYNPNFSAYKYYGGSGVVVCDRWLHFKNFEEDAPKIQNYENFVLEPKKYSLDKDIKGGKIYSLETCIFVTHAEQMQAQKRVKKIKAISEKGEEFIFPSVNQMCLNLSLQDANVFKVIKGERKHTKGFTFEYIKEC